MNKYIILEEEGKPVVKGTVTMEKPETPITKDGDSVVLNNCVAFQKFNLHLRALPTVAICSSELLNLKGIGAEVEEGEFVIKTNHAEGLREMYPTGHPIMDFQILHSAVAYPASPSSEVEKTTNTNMEIPRRARLDLYTPAELAISNAVLEIEKMGVDVALTDAVVLLQKAKDRVADFIDNEPDWKSLLHIPYSGPESNSQNIPIEMFTQKLGEAAASSEVRTEESEAPRCTLADAELIEKCKQWISDLCKSGGKAWTLRVPVDFHRDPDMLFSELIRRFAASRPADNKEEEAEAGWISVEEKLPTPFEYVLCASESGHVGLEAYQNKMKAGKPLFDNPDSFGPSSKITHWMPLPATPSPVKQ